MSNLLVNVREQEFLLYEQFGIEKLFASARFMDFSRDIVDMMLKEAEKLAVNAILPTYQEGDREGCRLDNGQVRVPSSFHEAYQKYIEGGWMAFIASPEAGGQGAPLVVGNACKEYMVAANYAFMMYPGLTRGAAALIESFGTEVQKRKYMDRMYAGQWGGTMCLTEPNAGTDVGALKTKAVRRADGTFNIIGTKCFISSGDQDLTANIVHPVLARIEGDPSGTKGISLFLVPKYRVNDDGSPGEPNDVQVGNIEHKMGIKGSATCTLNFGDQGNCIGELLGNEREGLKCMFQMMNEARIGVGMQGLGHATAAYEHAVAYAKERIQGAPLGEMHNQEAKPVAIIHHPYIKRMLLWMKACVEGIRALNYFTAYALDMSRIAESTEARDRWNGFVELLTPVCKAYSSDKSFEVCSKAMEVYGGYGYCAEYPMEQYVRDCKIAAIYEGTNGIQALDLVGRKLSQRKGANVLNLLHEIEATVTELKNIHDFDLHRNELQEATVATMALIAKFGEFNKSGNFLIPLLYATPFLDILGDLLVGWLLLQGACLAHKKLEAIYYIKGVADDASRLALDDGNRDVAFYRGKVASAQYFAVHILSTIQSRCNALGRGEKSALDISPSSFAY